MSGSDGSGNELGSAPMRATSSDAACATTVAAATASSEAGSDRRIRGATTITATTSSDHRDGLHLPVGERVAHRPHGDRGGVLAVRLGDAERGRDLLQEDDHGDADREPLDHRPRHVRQVAPEAAERGGDDQHAGDQPDDEHRVGAVLGDDRHQHHRHRPGRARHLHVRAAERRRPPARRRSR